MANEKLIIEKLDEIKSELDFIKDHIKDVDTILTGDDIDSIKEAKEDLNKGNTKRII